MPPGGKAPSPAVRRPRAAARRDDDELDFRGGPPPWNLTLARRSRSSAPSCASGSPANAPDELAELADWNMPGATGGDRRDPRTVGGADQPRVPHVGGPQAVGGPADLPATGRRSTAARAWTRSALAVLNEEFYRAGVPRVTRGMGESLVGPSIIVHGTPEQKADVPAADHLRRGPLLPGLLRAQPRVGPGRGGDQGRGRRRRDRHHRPEGLDLRRDVRQQDVHPVPHRPDRAQARRPVLRADRLHRPGRDVPADQADLRRGRVRRGLLRRGPGAAVQRHRRAEQRLAGRDDHARQRARRPGHRPAPRASSGSTGSWSRPRASTARTPSRWSASSSPGPTPRSS